MRTVATVGVYPALSGTSGTSGTTCLGMVLGSITVAAFFMPLVGLSFVILSAFQVGALVFVSLFVLGPML